MRLLLDTHVLLAIVNRRIDLLNFGVRRAVISPSNELAASVVSLWEIAIKFRLGKLQLEIAIDRLPVVLAELAIEALPITASHALHLVRPEPITKDPFDRLLLAVCAVEGLRLATLDRALVAHPLALGA